PGGVATDGQRVYWTTGSSPGSIRSTTLNGGMQTVAENQIFPGAIAVDNANVYWANSGSNPGQSADGAIMAAPKAGGMVSTLFSNLPNPANIAIDESYVYFVTSVPGGAVMAVPNGGGQPIKLAVNQDSPHGIAVDKTNVYWTSGGLNGSIMKIAKP